MGFIIAVSYRVAILGWCLPSGPGDFLHLSWFLCFLSLRLRMRSSSKGLKPWSSIFDVLDRCIFADAVDDDLKRSFLVELESVRWSIRFVSVFDGLSIIIWGGRHERAIIIHKLMLGHRNKLTTPSMAQ